MNKQPAFRVALIVNQDPIIRQLLQAWIGEASYVVHVAENGQQAMALIEAHHPHVIVSDWDLPDVDGIELCRWIRQQNLPHYVYTVIITDRTGTDAVVLALEAGADDLIQKPLPKSELIARLGSAQRVLDLEDRLSKMAKTDPLTGLATRRTFQDHLQREWRRAQRHFFPLSCVMVDIDFFKRINDTYGHPAGDEVIRQVAKLLDSNIRGSDLVSRFGGEEFCVLLPETDEQNAFIWADRMRQKIQQTVIHAAGIEIPIAASMGVAQRMADTKSPEDLIDMADQALLVAKNSGRNRVLNFASLNSSPAESSDNFSPERLFRGLSAAEVMTSVVSGLQAEESVRSAVQFFLRFRVGSAPVVDAAGNLVGILSEKDVMAIMLLPNWWQKPVSEVMKSNVVCYEQDVPAIRIYEFLCRVSIRTAVIVKDKKPLGLINRGSLLRWFANNLAANHQKLDDADFSTDLSAPLPGFDAKEQLQATSRALVTEADRLQARLMDCSGDVSSSVIGGASRIQELVNDLLVNCNYATPSKEADKDQVFGLAGLLEAMGGSLTEQ